MSEEIKVCQNCGKEIIKRDNENAYRYTRRKYCSQLCYNLLMRREGRGWYKSFSMFYKPKEDKE